ncbi:MAG: alcohol dehydrogenase catalytic domain-containing protein [Anaerolineae bacterium]
MPTPQAVESDDVQSRMSSCAICVGETKVHEWGDWAAAGRTLQWPSVLGHECSHSVTARGGSASASRVGNRITEDPLIYSGRCYQWRSGHRRMDLTRAISGKCRDAFAEHTHHQGFALARSHDVTKILHP